MKKRLLIGFTIGLLLIGLMGSAQATILNSYISMDNGFKIYLSTDDALQGTEFGAGESWPTTYNYTTTLLAGSDYYLHVYGYDTGGIAGFLGEFSLSGSDHYFVNDTTSLLTNTTDWNGNITGWGSPYIALTDLGSNGVSPWGTRPGISNSARWIWPGDPYDDVAYFSTKISAVPEPTTLLLLGSGLVGLAGFRRKKK